MANFESDADLAGFFDPADFAATASYQPAAGGQAFTVHPIIDDPRETESIGASGLFVRETAKRILRIPATEVAQPLAGDTLTIGARVLTVKGAELDASARVWIVDAVE